MFKEQTSLEERLFKSVQDERWLEISKGLMVHYKYSQFTLQWKKQLSLAKRLLLNTKQCLAIYTKIQPGELKVIVQPFWFKFQLDNDKSFFNASDNNFDKENLIHGQYYYICIYRHAADYVYRVALSQQLNYFVPHQIQKSKKILRFIKGETSFLRLDQQFNFRTNFQFVKDEMQARAIRKAGKSRMMLIRGGAGTGKTSTSCKIGVQFCLKAKKVLIATVTNAASRAISDHLVTELAYQDSQRAKIIVNLMMKLKDLRNLTTQSYSVLPQNKEAVDYLDRQIKWMIFEMEKQPTKIHFLYFNLLVTFEEYFCLYPLLRGYSFNTHVLINFIKLTDYQMPITEILSHLNKIAHKVFVQENIKSYYMRALQLVIKRANFVVTNAAKAAVINHFQHAEEHFQPHIAIFDEAAQSTLADLYTLLNMDIKRLFLIGDKMQLSPFTKGPNDELRYSILDLLQGRNLRQVILKKQYRMHSEIAHIINHLRYNGQLANGYSQNVFLSQLKGFQENPVLMVTHEQPQQLVEEMNEHGYSNTFEIMMIKLLIDSFPDDSLHQFGIVTVYKAQAKIMKNVFAEEIKLGLIISTVDGYQGGQKDYLIASIVTSNDFGRVQFAADPNRITVLLSRARKGLMIIGNTSTLRQGYQDNLWKPVISYLFAKNAVFQFSQELKKEAIQNYEKRIVRKTNIPVQFDLAFDVMDEEELAKEKSEVHGEIDLLPFIKSDYN